MRRISLLALLVGPLAVLAWVLAPSGTPAREAETGPYAPAEWRLNPSRLVRVIFPLAHIVVTHSDSKPLADPAPWMAPPHSARSRADARDRALEALSQLRAGDATFEEVAQRYSDDAVTRSHGGRLGNVPAQALAPEYLDAIYSLGAGNLSRVFETPMGFHLVARLPVTPATIASAEGIVIAHADAPDFFRSIRKATRTRAEAERLAQEVAEAARRDPATWSRLVQEHSDYVGHDNGAMGPVSTRDANRPYAVAEVLRDARVGDVLGPIDTPEGYYILRKQAPGPTTTLAAELLLCPHADAPAGRINATAARADAQAYTASLLSQLGEAPADSALRELADRAPPERHCYVERLQWFAGQHETALESALRTLAAGELYRAPIDTAQGVVLVRREQPAGQAEMFPDFTVETPRFEFADRALLVENLDADMLAKYTGLFGADLIRELGLAGEVQARVQSAFARAVESFSTCPVHERGGVSRELEQELHAILDTHAFERYRAYSDRWLREKQLQP